MAKREERRKAIKLRKQGKTYSEIRSVLSVAKSTLSEWLSDYPLTKTQLEKLEINRERRRQLGVEKTRLVKLEKREQRLEETYKKEANKLLPLSKRELYLCGLFLYWGEGVKNIRASISLNNTDPKVVKFYYHWLTDGLKIPKDRLRVIVHLYKDMDVEKTLEFWSRFLIISRKQFIKPYIKKSTRKDVDHKGYGYGTCGLYINDQYLKERIILGIEAIADSYYKKK